MFPGSLPLVPCLPCLTGGAPPSPSGRMACPHVREQPRCCRGPEPGLHPEAHSDSERGVGSQDGGLLPGQLAPRAQRSTGAAGAGKAADALGAYPFLWGVRPPQRDLSSRAQVPRWLAANRFKRCPPRDAHAVRFWPGLCSPDPLLLVATGALALTRGVAGEALALTSDIARVPRGLRATLAGWGVSGEPRGRLGEGGGRPRARAQDGSGVAGFTVSAPF